MALFFYKSQIAPEFELGAVPCGIISYVATIPCATLFSYTKIVFTTFNNL